MVSDQPPVNKPMTQQSNSHTPLAICSHLSPCISYELRAVFNLSASEQLGHLLYTFPAAERGATCLCSWVLFIAPGTRRGHVEGNVETILDLTVRYNWIFNAHANVFCYE